MKTLDGCLQKPHSKDTAAPTEVTISRGDHKHLQWQNNEPKLQPCHVNLVQCYSERKHAPSGECNEQNMDMHDQIETGTRTRWLPANQERCTMTCGPRPCALTSRTCAQQALQKFTCWVPRAANATTQPQDLLSQAAIAQAGRSFTPA